MIHTTFNLSLESRYMRGPTSRSALTIFMQRTDLEVGATIAGVSSEISDALCSVRSFAAKIALDWRFAAVLDLQVGGVQEEMSADLEVGATRARQC